MIQGQRPGHLPRHRLYRSCNGPGLRLEVNHRLAFPGRWPGARQIVGPSGPKTQSATCAQQQAGGHPDVVPAGRQSGSGAPRHADFTLVWDLGFPCQLTACLPQISWILHLSSQIIGGVFYVDDVTCLLSVVYVDNINLDCSSQSCIISAVGKFGNLGRTGQTCQMHSGSGRCAIYVHRGT